MIGYWTDGQFTSDRKPDDLIHEDSYNLEDDEKDGTPKKDNMPA